MDPLAKVMFTAFYETVEKQSPGFFEGTSIDEMWNEQSVLAIQSRECFEAAAKAAREFLTQEGAEIKEEVGKLYGWR
jgi:glycine cleavage system pyridoxal-binding protein P